MSVSFTGLFALLSCFQLLRCAGTIPLLSPKGKRQSLQPPRQAKTMWEFTPRGGCHPLLYNTLRIPPSTSSHHRVREHNTPRGTTPDPVLLLDPVAPTSSPPERFNSFSSTLSDKMAPKAPKAAQTTKPTKQTIPPASTTPARSAAQRPPIPRDVVWDMKTFKGKANKQTMRAFLQAEGAAPAEYTETKTGAELVASIQKIQQANVDAVDAAKQAAKPKPTPKAAKSLKRARDARDEEDNDLDVVLVTKKSKVHGEMNQDDGDEEVMFDSDAGPENDDDASDDDTEEEQEASDNEVDEPEDGAEGGDDEEGGEDDNNGSPDKAEKGAEAKPSIQSPALYDDSEVPPHLKDATRTLRMIKGVAVDDIYRLTQKRKVCVKTIDGDYELLDDEEEDPSKWAYFADARSVSYIKEPVNGKMKIVMGTDAQDYIHTIVASEHIIHLRKKKITVAAARKRDQKLKQAYKENKASRKALEKHVAKLIATDDCKKMARLIIKAVFAPGHDEKEEESPFLTRKDQANEVSGSTEIIDVDKVDLEKSTENAEEYAQETEDEEEPEKLVFVPAFVRLNQSPTGLYANKATEKPVTEASEQPLDQVTDGADMPVAEQTTGVADTPSATGTTEATNQPTEELAIDAVTTPTENGTAVVDNTAVETHASEVDRQRVEAAPAKSMSEPIIEASSSKSVETAGKRQAKYPANRVLEDYDDDDEEDEEL
ncbi:hypothetical protein P154DRAFT_167646 [Amniculicola lignicola CBS 123094]|uniref:Uncharacterized protein n=1 Tax=Amniculicola lignicola CBS 123094 TaxID=1392246 RepID=A0A6A5W528_9PLEO|nr:hypothetical protein P154DRAFT_167646 [Amniculicola lignicola CBS 123094]